MAESKRRGKSPVDDRVDGISGDAGDETFDDAYLDDEPADEIGTAETTGAARGGTATKTRARPSREAATTKPSRSHGAERIGLWARLARFFREIVAELRKVIWPTRNELITYTTVVVVFVTVIVAIVAGLDSGFAALVLKVFGK